jgi:hypothetical protein
MLLAKLLMMLVIASGFVWSVREMSALEADSLVDFIADDTLRGGTYPAYEIRHALDESDTGHERCSSRQPRSMAIASLALYEWYNRDKLPQIPAMRAQAKRRVVASLNCNASDAFLWLALFRMETSNGNVSPSAVAYLQQSYALGPNEGWVMNQRSKVAAAVLPQLPSELKAKVGHDVATLIAQGYWSAPKDILTKSDKMTRAYLVQELRARSRMQLGRFLLYLRSTGDPAEDFELDDPVSKVRKMGQETIRRY